MEGVARRDVLARVLDDLVTLTAQARRAYPEELARRLREDRLRVLVVGEAKRGKSTVVNALLGRAVLPTGVTPLTAIATTVTYGADEHVSVQRFDGHSETFPLSALPQLVTEDGNPHNRRGLARVVVYLDAPLLAEGVELVDAPGTGSVFAHNTAAAREALEAMDAAVFVLTADPPISNAERELLAQVRAASVATFVILNKIDRLDEVERTAAVAFTERVIGPGTRIYPCSARVALSHGPATDAGRVDGTAAAGGGGFAAFAADFTQYLERDRAGGLLRSLTRQAADWAGALRDEVRVTRRADELRTGADAARVEAFRGELDAIEQRRREAADLVHAQAGHLLEQLNADAAQAVAANTAQIRTRLDELTSGQLAQASPAQIYEQGRDLATRTATGLVEPWRTQQAAVLQRELDRLGERLRASLERDLGAVREAAKTLLGTELAVPATGVRLVADPQFHYAPPAPEGPTEALAAAVRRHLPGRAGRERAVAAVRSEAEELADRMVGRARGDLQYRLTETAHAATAALAERYAQCSAHLSGALDAAQRMSRLTQAEAQSARAALIAREQSLGDLLRRLSRLADEPQVASATAGQRP
jgi:GTP-binding protein EngB required for normal cell division